MVVTITEQVIEAMSDYSQSNPRNSKLDQLLTFLRTIYRDKEHHHVVWVGVVGTGVTGKKLNASYESRSSPDYAAELGNTLVNITRLVPNGLLVFFPSYSILDQCTGQWQQLTGSTGSIWDRLGALKTIFVEPKNRVEFTGVVQAYHDAIRDRPTAGAIFFAVCRGKVSEGIDFSDENGRAVVITGLPFPPTKDPKIVLKKAFLDNQVVPPHELVMKTIFVHTNITFVYHRLVCEAHGGLTRFFRRNKEHAAAAAAATAAVDAKVKALDTFQRPPPASSSSIPTPASSSSSSSKPFITSKPSDVLASQVPIGDGQSFVPPAELQAVPRPPFPSLPTTRKPPPPVTAKSTKLELLVHETRQLMTPTQVTAFISYMRDPRRYLPEIDALLDAYPSLRRHIAPMLPPRSVAHAMDQLNQ
ncbi:hypothetical protein DYB25_011288, partial [Aphanomyces astaci]